MLERIYAGTSANLTLLYVTVVAMAEINMTIVGLSSYLKAVVFKRGTYSGIIVLLHGAAI